MIPERLDVLSEMLEKIVDRVKEGLKIVSTSLFCDEAERVRRKFIVEWDGNVADFRGIRMFVPELDVAPALVDLTEPPLLKGFDNVPARVRPPSHYADDDAYGVLTFARLGSRVSS